MPGSTPRAWVLNPAFQLACAALTFALGIYHLSLLDISIQLLQGNDFGKFYYAVHSWRVGWSLYATTSATHMQVGTQWVDFLDMNPPHFHLLVWPLASLPLWEAAYLWWLVNIAVGVLAGVVALRTVGRSVHLRYVFPCAVAVLASGPAGAISITNQFVGLLLLLVVLAWRSARQGHQVASGLWLGILISIKPFVGLLLPPLLLRREWRTAMTAVLSMSACFAIGLVVFGGHEHREWVASLERVEWAWAAMNASFAGVTARLLAPSPFDPLLIAPRTATTLFLAGASFFAVVTINVARRSVDHLYSAGLLGALLASPLGWVYYVWLALPGFLGLWQRSRPTRLFWLAQALLLVPFYGPPHSEGFGPAASSTIGSVFFWAVLCMWWSLVFVPSRHESDIRG